MNYVLIENGVVVQSDRSKQEPKQGFVEAPDDVVPGYLYDGDFSLPQARVKVPERVTANQFGKQLIAAGLMDQVQGWVSQQDAATQWSFNRSGSFVRTEPMMQAGFQALGFKDAQIDAFFTAAAAL
jgi:hypothetical protein